MFRVSAQRKKHMTLKAPVGPFEVKVGFPSGKTSGEIVMRAIWNHYGTRGGASGGGWGGPIPPRPFLLNAVRKNRAKYLENMRKGAKGIIRGTHSTRAILSRLGIEAADDIRQEITDLKSPPNSPTTIKMKGSSNPLIDTGEMRSKVTWKVGK